MKCRIGRLSSTATGLKKALKSIKDASPKEFSKKRVEETLVVLTAIEKGDNLNLVEEYVKTIHGISKQIGTRKIVLYPYAHLSNNLGSPKCAIEIFEKADKMLNAKGYKVHCAPFGDYKSFELKVKGHPLSELSREIIVKKNEEVEEKK